MRLTERGRWVLVYLPAALALEAVLVLVLLALFGSASFDPDPFTRTGAR